MTTIDKDLQGRGSRETTIAPMLPVFKVDIRFPAECDPYADGVRYQELCNSRRQQQPCACIRDCINCPIDGDLD